MNTPSIVLHDLTAGYGRHPAIHHLHATIPCGALLAVAGPNGAGKSTLLKVLAGELKPMTGHVSLPAPCRQRLAYLTQQPTWSLDFPVDVHDAIAMGCWPWLGPWRAFDEAAHRRVADAIAAVKLQGFERRPLESLSGGQLQRVRFAQIIVQDARLILLDEPFNALDETTEEEFLTLIHRWHEEGRTVIAVLHDLARVRRYFPLTLLLARELVAFGPTEQVLCAEYLDRARRHAEAFDEHAAPCPLPVDEEKDEVAP
ncbi:MAG: metal ABC transporter ATP-binding protein [Tepidiphilus sp.]|nr:metal ABC transporter ATP-binding protein [Tepidiphilus sp.]MDK2797726.1 zinc/manganese transport system ATP-binding protein [Tepidiphilus sp.]